MKTAKSILHKSSDPYLRLLSYRSAPLGRGHSPAQLSMSRNITTTIAVVTDQLKPSVVQPDCFKAEATSMEQGHYHLWKIEIKYGFPIFKQKEQSKEIQQQEATMCLLRKERSDEIGDI